MSIAFTTQDASRGDVDEIFALCRANDKTLGYVPAVVVKDSVRLNEAIVSRLGEEVIGYAHFHNRRDQVCTIRTIVVDKLWRRMGIGRSLLLHVEMQARASLMLTVRLKCQEANFDAMRFYYRLGYTHSGYEQSKKSRLCILEKDLTNEPAIPAEANMSR